MLNLHEIISGGLKLERIFRDLHRMLEGDYIYGRKFVTETAIKITDTLDRIIFHLNALTAGNDIDLFYFLDTVKKRITECFDESHQVDVSIPGEDNPAEMKDSLSVLLLKVMNCATGADLAHDSKSPGKAEDLTTARDLLSHCYGRTFAVVGSWFGSVAGAMDGSTLEKTGMIGIPTSYMGKDNKPIFETMIADGGEHQIVNPNTGVSRFMEGADEVSNSGHFALYLEDPSDTSRIQGMIVYSDETMALYHRSDRFRSIAVASVCDDVGSNYIHLLIVPVGDSGKQAASLQFIRRLLDWLDFYTFAESGFISAYTGNMTRSDTENHLNITGKLLSFSSSTRIPISDEESAKQNIEIFLECIV